MIYLFNNQEEVIKVIPQEGIKEAYHTQELTKEGYVSDHLYAAVRPLSEEVLKEIEFVAIPFLDDPQRFHFMFVANINTEGNHTEIDAVQSGIEELKKSIIYDRRVYGWELRDMIDVALEDTNWSAGFVPADLGKRSTNFYYIDAFEALTKICAVFNVEMQFSVEISGNKINKRVIEFKQRLGKNTGQRVVYGHNALKIKYELKKSGVVTALVGRGKGEEMENEEGETYHGRKINFGDLEWSVDKGDPVDKPKGQQYVELVDMTAKYGIKTPHGMQPKVGVLEIDQEEDRESLLQRTYEALLDMARPQVLFETDAVFLSGAEIGDTVRVVRPDLDLDYRVRVIKIEWNLLNPKVSTLEFGDRVESSYDRMLNRVGGMISDMEEMQAESTEKLLDYITSADGKNTNWFTDKDPNEVYPGKVGIGDMWYRPDPEHEGETIMLTWDGEAWVEVLRTKNWNVVEEEIKRLEAIAAEGLKAIEEANRRAEEMMKEVPNIDALIAKIPTEEEIMQNVPSAEEIMQSVPSADEILSRIPDLEDIRDQFRRVDNNSEMIAQIIGEEGMLTYSKNWVDTEIDTSQPIVFSMEDGQFCFVPSMGKLKVGEPVTISGYRKVDYYDNSTVTVNFKESARASSAVTVNFLTSKLKQSKVVARFEEI